MHRRASTLPILLLRDCSHLDVEYVTADIVHSSLHESIWRPRYVERLEERSAGTQERTQVPIRKFLRVQGRKHRYILNLLFLLCLSRELGGLLRVRRSTLNGPPPIWRPVHSIYLRIVENNNMQQSRCFLVLRPLSIADCVAEHRCTIFCTCEKSEMKLFLPLPLPWT